MHARPLKVAKIMYIFQLMFQRSGGTAKARTQFQNQFEAVARETALARILLGKIYIGKMNDWISNNMKKCDVLTSAGYVQEEGPQVVENVATNKYEQATIADDTAWLLRTTHVMSLFSGVLVSSVLGWP